MDILEKVKKFLETIKEKNIKFKQHFYDQIKDRPINKDLVLKYLKKTDRLSKVEKQPSKRKGEENYKL